MRDLVLDKAFSKRGVVTAIAKECGISTAAVSQWDRVPKERLEVTARLSGIPAVELRPDLAAELTEGAT